MEVLGPVPVGGEGAPRAGRLGEAPQGQDALVGDEAVDTRVQHRVVLARPSGDVVGAEDGHLGGVAQP